MTTRAIRHSAREGEPGHPRNEPVTEITVSHLWGAAQCITYSLPRAANSAQESLLSMLIECTVTVIPCALGFSRAGFFRQNSRGSGEIVKPSRQTAQGR